MRHIATAAAIALAAGVLPGAAAAQLSVPPNINAMPSAGPDTAATITRTTTGTEVKTGNGAAYTPEAPAAVHDVSSVSAGPLTPETPPTPAMPVIADTPAADAAPATLPAMAELPATPEPNAPEPARPPVMPSLNEPMPIRLQNGVATITGGTTLEEIEQFRSMDSEFNLQVLFASKNKDNLVVQSLRLLDDTGREMTASYAAGPYFYAFLRPGDYMLEIVYEPGMQPVRVAVKLPEKGRIRKTILLK